MDDSERYRLIGGPYAPPPARRGDVLTCEHRGRDVTVGGMSDGRIQWPRALKTGRPSLILCGDLVEAVKRESSIAVAHWWGVSVPVVWRWRQALGIGRVNEGTRRLYEEYGPEKLTDDVAAKGREAAARPEAVAKIAAARRGRPMHPRTRAALLEAVKRPKSEAWKAKASERWREWHRRRRAERAAEAAKGACDMAGEDRRRIMLTVRPELYRAAGLDPETVGAREVDAVLRKWGAALQAAGRDVAAKFARAEWNCLADASNGLIWDDSVPPAVVLRAQVEDGHALDGLGAKWFGDDGADAAVAALAGKLDALSPAEGEAVAAALRWLWDNHESVDMAEDRWWHPAFRAGKPGAGA